MNAGMQLPLTTRRRRAPGWWYPWIFVAGMAVVILVNAIMITFAVRSFSGIETEDQYRKGIAYNEALSGARAQAELGWQGDVAFARMPSGAAVSVPAAGMLSVRLTDRAGHPLDGLVITAIAIRPTVEGYDRHLHLKGVGQGRYEGALVLPLEGQWDMQVLAVQGRRTFQFTRRLHVR